TDRRWPDAANTPLIAHYALAVALEMRVVAHGNAVDACVCMLDGLLVLVQNVSLGQMHDTAWMEVAGGRDHIVGRHVRRPVGAGWLQGLSRGEAGEKQRDDAYELEQSNVAEHDILLEVWDLVCGDFQGVVIEDVLPSHRPQA